MQAEEGRVFARPSAKWVLEDCYVLGLKAFVTGLDLEFDTLFLFELAVSVGLNCLEVDEDVWAVVLSDETKTLLRVEPLNGSLCHLLLL